jgi:hypothetical protein
MTDIYIGYYYNDRHILFFLISVLLISKDCSVAQKIIRWLLTAKPWVQFPIMSFEICSM